MSEWLVASMRGRNCRESPFLTIKQSQDSFFFFPKALSHLNIVTKKLCRKKKVNKKRIIKLQFTQSLEHKHMFVPFNNLAYIWGWTWKQKESKHSLELFCDDLKQIECWKTYKLRSFFLKTSQNIFKSSKVLKIVQDRTKDCKNFSSPT